MWKVKMLLYQAGEALKKHWPVVVLVVGGVLLLNHAC